MHKSEHAPLDDGYLEEGWERRAQVGQLDDHPSEELVQFGGVTARVERAEGGDGLRLGVDDLGGEAAEGRERRWGGAWMSGAGTGGGSLLV